MERSGMPELFPQHCAPAPPAPGKRVLSADSGLASVGGAALFGIVRAAQAQYAGVPPRINELRIYALVTRHGGMSAFCVRVCVCVCGGGWGGGGCVAACCL